MYRALSKLIEEKKINNDAKKKNKNECEILGHLTLLKRTCTHLIT